RADVDYREEYVELEDGEEYNTAHECPVCGIGALIESAVDGDPNQVVSASRNPVSVPSPTQAVCPSGLISTAAGAATWPRTGSSQSPAYLTSIANTRSAHAVMSNPPGSPRLSSTGRALCSSVNT